MPTGPDERPVRMEGLEVNEVDEGLVLYQAHPEKVHYLNHTAALVFELCSGERTVSEIAAFLAQAFSLPAPPVADVVACVADLRAKEVLRPEEAVAPAEPDH